MAEAVEQGGRHPFALEHLHPVAERQVARQQQAPPLVAVGEDPEQQLHAAPADRHVAQLVADQQVAAVELAQEPVQRVLLLLLLQPAHQLRRREEPHPVARAAGRQPQRRGHVRLARPRAADQAAVVLLVDPLAARQLQHLRLGELRDRREVERVQVLEDREPRRPDPRGHRVGRPHRQLRLGQAQQELGIGLVRGCRVPGQFLELLAHRRQPQLAEMHPQQLVGRIGHDASSSIKKSGLDELSRGRRRSRLRDPPAASGPRQGRLRIGIGPVQEQVEPAQVRGRHPDHRRAIGHLRRPRPGGDRRQGVDPADHRVGRGMPGGAAGLDRLADARQRVLGEQLQDPGVLPRAGRAAVLRLEVRAERAERGRQRPVAEHRSPVEGPRLGRQGRQVVQRIEHHRVPPLGPDVAGDHLAAIHDDHPVDVPLDRHRAEGQGPGDAVAAGVQGHGLVLVHRHRRVDHAGVERPAGEGRGGGEVLGQPVGDPERPVDRLHGPVAFGEARLAQGDVQLVEPGDAGHRRGEPPLDRLDRRLGVGLLVAPGGHAELRLEDVVAGQGGVARVDLPLAALEDQAGDGPGIVPPDLARHATEEGEGLGHAMEDRLGPLERQGQHERRIGVGPDGDQEGDEPASVGEVDMDVPEVGLEPLAREVSERDEGLAVAPPLAEQVPLDLGIPAAITVLGLEPAPDLGGGVPLLGGGVAIGLDDPIDGLDDRPEHRGLAPPGRGDGLGMGQPEDLADGVAGMPELPGDLLDGHTVAVGPANGSIIVHRKHILDLHTGDHSWKEDHHSGGGLRGSELRDQIGLKGVNSWR